MDARDRQVAVETVRPRHECNHCNPGVRRPRDDFTPVAVTALPPWACCGGQGPHAPFCPNGPQPED